MTDMRRIINFRVSEDEYKQLERIAAILNQEGKLRSARLYESPHRLKML
jgi:hypothetical protein